MLSVVYMPEVVEIVADRSECKNPWQSRSNPEMHEECKGNGSEPDEAKTKPENEKISTGKTLPDVPLDILLLIFGYLPVGTLLTLMTVSRQLSRLACRGSFFRVLDFRGMIRTPNARSQILSRVLPVCGSSVRTLDVSYQVGFDAEIYERIANHCRNLRSLSLSGASGITPAGLSSLMESNPQLRMLEIANLKFVIDDRLVTNIASKLPDLECLDLSGFLTPSNLTDRSVSRLAAKCICLQEVRLINCRSLSDVSIVELAEHCPALRKLNIQGCFKVTDVGVKRLLELSNLESLNVNYIWRLTDECFENVGVSVGGRILGIQMKRLDLEFCYQLTERSIECLIRAPNLQYLNVAHCSGIPLDEIKSRATGMLEIVVQSKDVL